MAISLKLHIKGMTNNKGKLMIALYDKKNFMKTPFQSLTAKIENYILGVTVVFEALPAGEYAVGVYHDENNNDKLDTNFFGMPIEKYGFSNNPPSRFGVPSFEAAKIILKNEQNQYTIKIE